MKRWHRVNAVFEQALELAPDGREEFVHTACAGDAPLENAVRLLLAADESAEGFLDDPLVLPDLNRERPGSESLPSPARIGPYRLLRQVGQGGMSTVYLARRDDEFQRQVALKLIRRGMETEESQRRLRAERAILGNLDHPWVARLYDGGTTDQGLPYFVMEYIEGQPADLFCDAQQLSVTQRLLLFQKILEAVRYAHQNLVVHRDLKPSNILVSNDATPKLLDFGIAKILNADLAAVSGEEATATWMRMLTPSYASPEQMLGGPVTTSSDVYSLGVLLFKLLTGSLPYRFDGQPPQEQAQTLIDTEPVLPSSVVAQALPEARHATARLYRTTAEHHYQQLVGDLDAIVSKATQPAQLRRYGSVEQFSRDLSRYLEGFPVEARPDTVGYRLGKFIRRHRKAVVVGALAVLTLALLVGLLVVANLRATRALARAEHQRDVTARVLAFTERILTLADPAVSHGETWTIRDVLGRSDDLIEEELAGEPEIRSLLHGTVGRVLVQVGEAHAGTVHLEKALRLQRELHGAESLETARALSDLGAARVEDGDFTQGTELSLQAVELFRELSGLQDPGSVHAFNTYVDSLCAEGDFETADAASKEALALARRLAGNEELATASALHNRALILNRSGDHEAAAALYREALAIRRAALTVPHPLIASSLRNLAATLASQGKTQEASRFYSLALEQQRQLFGGDHPDLAPTLNNIAVLHRKAGNFAMAEAAYRQAIDLFGEGEIQRLRLRIELASLLDETGRNREARRLLRRELAHWRQELPPDNTLLAWAENGLGAALTTAGRFEEAESLLLRSLPLIRERRGPSDQYTQKALRRLVALYKSEGNSGEAARFESQLVEP